MKDGVYVISNMINGVKGLSLGFLLSQGGGNLLAIAMSFTILIVVGINFVGITNRFLNRPIFRWLLYYILVLFIVLFRIKAKNDFIYFGF